MSEPPRPSRTPLTDRYVSGIPGRFPAVDVVRAGVLADAIRFCRTLERIMGAHRTHSRALFALADELGRPKFSSVPPTEWIRREVQAARAARAAMANELKSVINRNR